MDLNFYDNGQRLRRWQVIDGQARCPEDAYLVSELDQPAIDAQLAANQQVFDAIAQVGAYEAALRVDPEEPPETLASADESGEPITIPNPDHAVWQDAQSTIANVSAETLALHEIRNPPPPPPAEDDP